MSFSRVETLALPSSFVGGEPLPQSERRLTTYSICEVCGLDEGGLRHAGQGHWQAQKRYLVVLASPVN